MKKNYISPIVRAIDIETEALLAGSPGTMEFHPTEGEGDESGGASNHRQSIWGDEL